MGGRGASGKTSSGSTASKSPLEMTDQEIIDTYGEYRYHATEASSIWSIYDEGLKPNRGHVGKGVYMAPTAEDAKEWTATSSTGGTTVLRVSTPVLYKKYAYSDIDELEGTTESSKPINSKYIEIYKGGNWMSLETYKNKRAISYNMYKRSKR